MRGGVIGQQASCNPRFSQTPNGFEERCECISRFRGNDADVSKSSLLTRLGCPAHVEL